MLFWIKRNLILVIALFAYLAMTSMFVYQEKVIDTQRTLIQQLYGDHLELTARKMHDIEAKAAK